MSPRRRIAALLLLCLLAACTGAEGVVQPSPSPTRAARPSPSASPSPSRSPRPSPSPSPPPAPAVLALTGLPAQDPAVVSRPVLAIKVDNAVGARPQTGLGAADIVFEELVEGGDTRFVALYHSTDPGIVGPMRSARDVDAQLLPAFSPVLAISGAAPPTLVALNAAGIRWFQETLTSVEIYKNPNLQRPHATFGNAALLWARAGDLPPARPPWPIGPIAPGGSPATSASMRFSTKARVGWEWDPAAGVWRRSQAGAPHALRDGSTVEAQNVLLMAVPTTTGSGVDSNGTPTNDINVIGEGDAFLLRDGQAFAARWHKPTPTDNFILTAGGVNLPLAPGRTWVELLPGGAPVDILPATPPRP